MKNQLRALLALVLLVGIPLLVVGLVAAAAFGVRALLDDGQRGYGVFRFALFTLALALAACWSFVRALVRRPDRPTGVALPRAAHPLLWDEVDAVAAHVGTRSPDEIRLVEEANAAVAEDAQPFRRTRRTMLLGAPLVVALDRRQLRSVLAHELGHYSSRHTRLSNLSHRGQVLLGDLVVRVGPRSLVGRVLRLYGRVYVAVASAVSRRQELEADRFSAEVSGAGVAAETLREVPLVAEGWHYFRRSDLLEAREQGIRPASVFQVFGALWHGADRRRIAARRLADLPRPASAFDTHPSLDERLAHLETVQVEPGVHGAADTEPASQLLAGADGPLQLLEAEMFRDSPLRVVPWEEVVADRGRRAALGAARQLGWAAEKEELAARGDLDALLDIVEAGQGTRLSGRFMSPTATEEQKQRSLGELLVATIENALVERHGFRHVPDQHGHPVLVRDDGAPVEIADLVAAAVTDQRAVEPLRRWVEARALLDVHRTLGGQPAS